MFQGNKTKIIITECNASGGAPTMPLTTEYTDGELDRMRA